jgi:hypothetical protein
MSVSIFPLFLMFPAISYVNVDIRFPNRSVRMNFSTPTSIFGIFFSSNESLGIVAVEAAMSTTFTYFAIGHSWICDECFVSSSPHETWAASSHGGNFTIQSSQSVRLFHISDQITTVTGRCNVDSEHQQLMYRYSDSNGSYSGHTGFSASSNHITAFRWSSNSASADQNSQFSIDLFSSHSHLPVSMSHGSGSSSEPILLLTEVVIPSASKSLKPGIGIGGWIGISIGCVAVLVAFGIVGWKILFRSKNLFGSDDDEDMTSSSGENGRFERWAGIGSAFNSPFSFSRDSQQLFDPMKKMPPVRGSQSTSPRSGGDGGASRSATRRDDSSRDSPERNLLGDALIASERA